MARSDYEQAFIEKHYNMSLLQAHLILIFQWLIASGPSKAIWLHSARIVTGKKERPYTRSYKESRRRKAYKKPKRR